MEVGPVSRQRGTASTSKWIRDTRQVETPLDALQHSARKYIGSVEAVEAAIEAEVQDIVTSAIFRTQLPSRDAGDLEALQGMSLGAMDAAIPWGTNLRRSSPSPCMHRLWQQTSSESWAIATRSQCTAHAVYGPRFDHAGRAPGPVALALSPPSPAAHSRCPLL